MKVLVVGVGYVGLVTATCLAEMGHHVVGIDIDENKVARLNEGVSPIFEPGLEDLLDRNLKSDRLRFSTDFQFAAESKVCFIAVNTPQDEDGSADLSRVIDVAQRLAPHIRHESVIVNKSTVPVGTAAKVNVAIAQELKLIDRQVSYEVVSNPEFLKEGSAIQDFMKPNRIIIGVSSDQAKTVMQELYAPFMFNHEKLIVMDPASAELTKYASNTMLANRISFMNWLSQICERTGADITNVRKGMGSDERIGTHFLYAGVGYGGSCFPKDIRALKQQAHQLGLSTMIIDAIDEINEIQKHVLVYKLLTYYDLKGLSLSGATIAILGLSFKPDTDDMREAPSLIIIQELLSKGVRLKLYDPVAMDNAKRIIGEHPNIEFCKDEYDAVKDTDAQLLVTEWKQFRSMDLEMMGTLCRRKLFFDGRNQYSSSTMEKYGFEYFSIGRAGRIALDSTPLFELESATK